MKIAIRGYVEGAVVFEEKLEGSFESIDAVIGEFASKHGELLKGTRHMVELEFLDEPDPLERFFRFGSDPRGMVRPVQVELGVPQ